MTGARLRWMAVSAAVVAVGVAGTADLSAATPGSTRSCPHPAIPVPPSEPAYSAGPTELVSGLYIQGGPVPPPPCRPKPRGPYAGTVRVADRRTGRPVAHQSVRDGHLAHIRLAAGRYNVTGQFSGGVTTRAVEVRVRAGHRVRQDMFEDVP